MRIDKLKKESSRAFVIAEIGNNHNSSFERAIEMIDKTKNSGFNYAKF